MCCGNVRFDRLQQFAPILQRLVVLELSELALCLRVEPRNLLTERIGGRSRFDERDALCNTREFRDDLRVKERVGFVKVMKGDGEIE